VGRRRTAGRGRALARRAIPGPSRPWGWVRGVGRRSPAAVGERSSATGASRRIFGGSPARRGRDPAQASCPALLLRHQSRTVPRFAAAGPERSSTGTMPPNPPTPRPPETGLGATRPARAARGRARRGRGLGQGPRNRRPRRFRVQLVWGGIHRHTHQPPAGRADTRPVGQAPPYPARSGRRRRALDGDSPRLRESKPESRGGGSN
jgi:hypothetical protein